MPLVALIFDLFCFSTGKRLKPLLGTVSDYTIVEMAQRYQRLYAACCVAILAFMLFNRQASKAAARYSIRLYDCRDGFAFVEMAYTIVETVSRLSR